MADGRDYVKNTDENGSINIAEDVISSIAALAAVDVPGVACLLPASGVDISELLGRKNLSKGVRLASSGAGVAVEITLAVRYGERIPDVAARVQAAVADALNAMAGLIVEAVNIQVGGVTFDKGETEKPAKKSEGDGPETADAEAPRDDM